MTKLSGSLPKENGLTQINSLMVNDPQQGYLVVGIVRPSKITTDVDTGQAEATAALHRLEVITGPDLMTADQLIRRATERRTGMQELPIDMEDELTKLLADVIDPETGELNGDQP
nr:hypothetical protein [Kocuria rhizophila]